MYFQRVIILCGLLPLFAMAEAGETIKWGGDFRAGYYGSETDRRDGTQSSKRSGRARIRYGFNAAINEKWSSQLRFAGHYSTDQTSTGFSFVPYNNSRSFGQSTFDIAQVRYQTQKLDIRFGRMQTKFELEGVAKKSLDRNDSPNMDIDFTDGIAVTRKGTSGWDSHFILQNNPAQGSTNVTRGPLDFTVSGTSPTVFVALEKKDKTGPWRQRGIDLTYIPNSLLYDGTNRSDYIGLVGRAARQWPLAGGSKFLLGMEAGYAPTTPQKSALGLGGTERAGGLAWQTTFNWLGFAPRQSIGLVLGETQGGWLLSPDFPNNRRLIEVRHRYQFNKKMRLESRIRNRVELEQKTTAVRKQDGSDFYVRFTWKL
ncbi:MAG: hypothetical protein ACC641_04300 [Acidiferrobacterales bacterium]